jgi:O-succinylbenzoic acid--CoA ligase
VITYGELFERIRETERGLAALGVQAGDVVAVLLDNGLAYAELLHAIAGRGAAILPLNRRHTPAEISFQLEESGARWLVAGAGALVELASASVKSSAQKLSLISIEADANGEPALANHAVRASLEEDERAPIDPEATLALVYTSGTAGRPKGVMLSPRSFYWSAVGSALHLGVEVDDRWLACLPLFHVGGLSILLRSALYGSAAIVQPGFDPGAVNRALDEEGATLVSLVPTMLRRLLEARGEKRSPESLRCVLLGGSGSPRGLVKRARALGFPVLCTYGLTEAASQVATQPLGLDGFEGEAGLRPLPGSSVQVVNAAGARVCGEPGEILVRGPTLMHGYSNHPSEEALRDGWLHTGDIGIQDADGGLCVLDRRSDLIISGGENVYPAEVESVLLEHPAVSEVAVAGCADREYGRRPTAWLVLRPGHAIDVNELRSFCGGRLARYKIPVAFTVVEALPRNASGKLARSQLGSSVPLD